MTREHWQEKRQRQRLLIKAVTKEVEIKELREQINRLKNSNAERANWLAGAYKNIANLERKNFRLVKLMRSKWYLRPFFKFI